MNLAETICVKCAHNFDKLVDGLLMEFYPRVAVMKEVLSKYSREMTVKNLHKLYKNTLILMSL